MHTRTHTVSIKNVLNKVTPIIYNRLQLLVSMLNIFSSSMLYPFSLYVFWSPCRGILNIVFVRKEGQCGL